MRSWPGPIHSPPPSTIWPPPIGRLRVRPPTRSRASSTISESLPRRVSSRAAVSPASPAPMMTTSVSIDVLRDSPAARSSRGDKPVASAVADRPTNRRRVNSREDVLRFASDISRTPIEPGNPRRLFDLAGRVRLRRDSLLDLKRACRAPQARSGGETNRLRAGRRVAARSVRTGRDRSMHGRPDSARGRPRLHGRRFHRNRGQLERGEAGTKRTQQPGRSPWV